MFAVVTFRRMASPFTATYPVVKEGHRSQLPPHVDRERPTLRRKPDRRAQPRVSPADIAVRAYELYEQRGRDDGHDVDDWLRAEQELQLTVNSTAT